MRSHDGQWDHAKKHGKGTTSFRRVDGDEFVFHGEWQYDIPFGYGTCVFPNAHEYTGKLMYTKEHVYVFLHCAPETPVRVATTANEEANAHKAMEELLTEEKADAKTTIKRRTKKRRSNKQSRSVSTEQPGLIESVHEEQLIEAIATLSVAASQRPAPLECEAPEEFFCPITQEVMHEPVFACDGHTYERAAIEKWLLQKQTSPNTNEALETARLTPNHDKRGLILKWQEKTLAAA